MYHIPEKLHLKKFKNVHIPRKKDLFRKYGERLILPSQVPDDAVFNSQPNRKIDTLQAVHNELYKQYARDEAEKARQAFENSKSNEDITE